MIYIYTYIHICIYIRFGAGPKAAAARDAHSTLKDGGGATCIYVDIYLYLFMYVHKLCDKYSEAVLGVWLPSPLPTLRGPPGRGALWPLARSYIWAGSMFDLAV